MKKVTIATIFAALMMISSAAFAQATANGTLNVTANVTGSIQLVFNTDTNGITLSGDGTNAATLAFGNVSAFGTLPAKVTRTVGTNNFTVTSAVDVLVSQVNSNSANYTLKAQLNAADATNTWTINNSGSLNTQQTLTATGTYGSKTNFPVSITIPFTSASGTSISNTINYVASAN